VCRFFLELPFPASGWRTLRVPLLHRSKRFLIFVSPTLQRPKDDCIVSLESPSCRVSLMLSWDSTTDK